MQPLALLDVLAGIPDPRSHHGVRHPLPAVLGLVALGVLLGHHSLGALARFVRGYGVPLAHALGFRRKPPDKSMLSRFLRRLDSQVVENALARWIRSRLPPDDDLVSLSSESVEDRCAGQIPGQHLLMAYALRLQSLLAAIRVNGNTDDQKVALRMLGILPRARRVVTCDTTVSQQDGCVATAERVDMDPDATEPRQPETPAQDSLLGFRAA